MKIFDLTCDNLTLQDCCNLILSKYPSARGISHIQHNHIVTFEADYGASGALIDSSIHDIAWKLGGVRKFDKGGSEIAAPNVALPTKSQF